MATIFNRIKAFAGSSPLMWIIVINVAVWAALRIAAIALFFATGMDGEGIVCRWVELPSSPRDLAVHWYGVITYMFSQYGILHLLFNMLWLYWFGRMFIEISTERQLTALYVYGGLAGAALFLAAYNLLPAFAGVNAWLIGSSASVLAIVTATAILMPDYPVGLFLIGTVKLKWIAIGSIIIVLLSVSGPNAGGEIAHIGGIIMGAVYALLRKNGRDITKPLNSMLDSIVNLSRGAGVMRKRKRTSPKAKKASPKAKPCSPISETDSKELDAILDKIKRSGYGGLTTEEKKRLFDVSSRIKSD